MDRTLETLQLFGSLFLTLLALFVPITLGIALLRRVLGPDRLRRWLGGRSIPVAVLKGTLLGAVTPFCGCSTIPVLVGLLKANVRFAGVAAFTLASPLLNPYILGVVTLLFGWRVAAAYTAVAVGSTIVLAVLWELSGLHRHLKLADYDPQVGQEIAPAARAPSPVAVSATSLQTVPATASDGGCEVAPASDERWRGLSVELPAAWSETRELLRPMILPMFVGLAIGALIYGAVPQGAFAQLLGTSSWVALPLAALLGLPLYLRGEAAFPIGAGLLAAGVGEGPMFAMVIAGMGASLPEVTILSGIFDRRLLAAFLASVFAMAVLGGALLPLVG
ncbi:MAG: permease [Actinomycetota bacterium]